MSSFALRLALAGQFHRRLPLGGYAAYSGFAYAAQFHDDGFAPIHRACWGHGENATATVLVFLEERTAPAY